MLFVFLFFIFLYFLSHFSALLFSHYSTPNLKIKTYHTIVMLYKLSYNIFLKNVPRYYDFALIFKIWVVHEPI